MAEYSEVMESYVAYGISNDVNTFNLIHAIREGIKFPFFLNIANKSSFSLEEWSGFLHLSERTLQRYKIEKKTFGQLQSEKIFEIAMLCNAGIAIFGDQEKFNIWLNSKNLVLGGIKPKELLDSSFGINLLKDELTRIEHGTYSHENISSVQIAIQS